MPFLLLWYLRSHVLCTLNWKVDSENLCLRNSFLKFGTTADSNIIFAIVWSYELCLFLKILYFLGALADAAPTTIRLLYMSPLYGAWLRCLTGSCVRDSIFSWYIGKSPRKTHISYIKYNNMYRTRMHLKKNGGKIRHWSCTWSIYGTWLPCSAWQDPVCVTAVLADTSVNSPRNKLISYIKFKNIYRI